MNHQQQLQDYQQQQLIAFRQAVQRELKFTTYTQLTYSSRILENIHDSTSMYQFERQTTQKCNRAGLKRIQKYYQTQLGILQEHCLNQHTIRQLSQRFPAQQSTITLVTTYLLYHAFYCFKELQKLILGECQIDQQTLKYLKHSGWQLKALIFFNCQFYQTSIRSLQTIDLRNLKQLDLKLQSLKNRELNQLASLDLPSLKLCSLYYNEITSDGLKLLQKCLWPNLCALNLSQNYLQITVLKSISKSASFPTQQLIFASKRDRKGFWLYNHIAKFPERGRKVNLSLTQENSSVRVGGLMVPRQTVSVVGRMFGEIDAY